MSRKNGTEKIPAVLRMGFLLLLLCQFSSPVFGQDRQQADIRQTFGSINLIRGNEGLMPLVNDDAASVSAQRHADELAERSSLSHLGLDGSRVAARYRSAGGTGLSAGENLGAGDSVERIISAWMDSPGHRENLLNPKWRKLGIGIHILESGRLIIVAVFNDSRFEIRRKDSGISKNSLDEEAFISGFFLLSPGVFPSDIRLSCSTGEFQPVSVEKQPDGLQLNFSFPVPGEWIEGLPAAFRIISTENGKQAISDMLILYP